MSDQKLERVQQTLQNFQSLCNKAMDQYQKPRDKESMKKFFPDIDKATGLVVDVLKDWPNYDSLSDADKIFHGSYLSRFCEVLLQKIQSKV